MPQPKLVHYTEGGPYHGYATQDYASLWYDEFADLMAGNNPCARMAQEIKFNSVGFEVHYEQTTQQHP